MERPRSDSIDVRASVEVLRRQRVIVVLVTAAVAMAALVHGLVAEPVYEGVTELAIEPVRSGGDAGLEDLILGSTVVETERRVITSRLVAERALAMLDRPVEDVPEVTETVTVDTIRDTRVVLVRATDPDPAVAAATADAFATAYLDHRRDRALEEVLAATRSLQQREEELRGELALVDRQLGTDDTGATADTALLAQRDALVQRLAQVGTQLATLDLGVSAVRGGGEVLVPAEVPEDPLTPRPVRDVPLALVIGLLLGLGLAFLRDHVDDAIRSDEDVARVGQDVPVIGRISHWDDAAADSRLITLTDPYAAASEEFQALSANVRFALVSGRTAGGRDAAPRSGEYLGQSLLVSSATPGEGKSSVAGNLAVAASAAGMRVVVVDGDLREPTLSGRFGLPDGAGLSDLLVALQGPEARAVVEDHLVEVAPRVHLLPAGAIPPNPTELLASLQMAWLHDCLLDLADLVIYDTPPLLPVADTLELAALVDTAVVVARAERAHRRDLQHALDRLGGVGADVAGFVVNDLPRGRRGRPYGYGGQQQPRETPVPAPPTSARRERTIGSDRVVEDSPRTSPPRAEEQPPTASDQPPTAPPRPAAHPATPTDRPRPSTPGEEDEPVAPAEPIDGGGRPPTEGAGGGGSPIDLFDVELFGPRDR